MTASSQPALIVVDVQRAFDEWEARGKRRNNPQAVARIVELLAAFRQQRAPIFHIRHEGTKPTSSFLPDGTGYPVKDEAREQGGEPVIVKRVNSAFIGTDLEQRLRTAGIKSLNSSIRNMRMSRTEIANQDRLRHKSITANTQVTALTSSFPK